MSRIRVSVWICAVFVVIARNQLQAAEPMFIALDYKTTASLQDCPDIAQLGAMVTSRLGYQPFRADALRRVVIEVSPTRDRLSGRIEWREAGQPFAERRFLSATGNCAELVRTMAFALAVQLQLLATVEPQPPNDNGAVADAPDRAAPEPGADGSSGAAPPPPTAARPIVAAVAPPPAAPSTSPGPAASQPDVAISPREARRLTMAVGGGPSVARGVTPENAFGLRLFGSARSGRAAVELDIEGTLPATTGAPDGAAFSHYRLGAMVAACYQPNVLGGCLVGSAARLTVRGSGVDTPASGSGSSFDAGFRAIATVPVGPRLFVRGRAELLAALTTLTVTLNGAPVWTRPRAAASLGLEVGLHFE